MGIQAHRGATPTVEACNKQGRVEEGDGSTFHNPDPLYRLIGKPYESKVIINDEEETIDFRGTNVHHHPHPSPKLGLKLINWRLC